MSPPAPAQDEERIPIELLRECPAFHSLSDEEVAELATVWRRVELPLGENLFMQGDPPGPVYLVESGRARVLYVDDATGHRSILGLRVRGDLVGERALLTGSPRMATVRAADDLSVWEMQPADFERFVDRFPDLRESLTVYFDQIGIRTFLKSISELTALKPERVRTLVSRLERIAVPDGKDVVVQGEPGDSMYFVSEGEAVVRVGGHLVRTISPGGFFGERALLTSEPRAGTVSAASDLVVYRLGRQDFEEMLEDAPAVRRKIYEEMEARLHYLVLQRDFGVQDASRTQKIRRGPKSTRIPRANRLPAWIRDYAPVLAYPVVLQRDEMDCGAACLATALAAYGVKRPLARIRDEVGGTREGATLEDLARAAEAMGFRASLTSRSLSELGQVPLPSIAFWNGNHYTVLFGEQGDRILLGDPAVGLRIVSPDEFVRGWTGILLELEPTSSLPRRDSFRASWAPLWSWLAGLRGALAAGAGLMVAEAAVVVYGIDRLGRILDEGARGYDERFGAVIAGALGWAVLRASRTLLFERAWRRWSRTGLEGYLDALLRMPGRFFERMTLSDLMLRSAMTSRMREWIDRTLEPLLFSMVLLTILSIHLFVTDPVCGGSVLLGLLAAEVIWSFAAIASRPRALLAAMSNAEATSQLTEVVSRIRDYRTAGLRGWVQRRWMSLTEQAQLDSARAVHYLWIGGAIGIVPLAVVWAVLLALVPLGVAFHAKTALLAWLIWRFTIASTSAWQVRLDVDRILEVLANRAPSLPAGGREASRGSDPPALVFEQVACPFEDSEAGRWLRGLSFEVEPGTSLAIVGPPGCGAWEVLRLAEASLDPLQGRVRLLARDRRPAEGAVRRTVGEDPIVLPGSVRENVKAGSPPVEGEAAAYGRAIDVAGLRPWIRRLPLGDATRLGPGGHRLGLEESQRLDLARALVAEPDLLLLCRALSGVDLGGRLAVLGRVLESLAGRTTVVMVPTSVEEARLADRILVLVEGRPVGDGRHEDLARDNPVYRQLLAGGRS